jgi:hypothetical protein
MDYTTPSHVFAYGNSLGTSTDPVNESALMAELVTGMSRAMDSYCNMAFSGGTYSGQVLRGIVDADGIAMCFPAVPTIASITAVGYRGVGQSSYQPVADLNNLDIDERSYGSVVRLLGQSYSAYRGSSRFQIQMSYTGGWATLQDVPADFEWACRRLCWWAYQKRSAPIDKTAFPAMGMVVIPSSWPADLKLMLRNYVRQLPV